MNSLAWHEYPPDDELVLLHADDRAALLAKVTQIAAALDRGETPHLREPATGDVRLAIVAPRSELSARMRQAAERLATMQRARLVIRDRGIYLGIGDTAGRIAFLFPGQGSQRLGMLRQACERFPSVRAWFDALDEIYRRAGEPSPTRLIFPRADAAQRDDDERALFDIGRGAQLGTVANLSLHDMLTQVGVAADFVLGHSNGEHAAVMAACMEPVRQRDTICEWLRRASKAGLGLGEPRVAQTMTAVSAIDAARLTPILAQHTGALFVAMDNCPHQQVIAGERSAVEAASREIAVAGGACGRLPFTRAYHTPLFADWAGVLEASYGDLPLAAPRIPVFSCLTGSAMAANPDAIRRTMAAQWTAPVRLRESVTALFAQGVRTFVEVGPSGTLSTFVEDTLRGQPHLAVATTSPHRGDVAQFRHCLAALHAHGVAINAQRFEQLGLAARPTEAIRVVSRAVPHDAIATAQQGLVDDARASMARMAEMFGVTPRAATHPRAPRKAGPLVGAWTSVGGRHVAERRFTRAADPILADHSLGRSTSPNAPSRSPLAVLSFTTSAAMAAEAASLIERDGVVVLSDLRAGRWLALDGGALTLRVEAEQSGDSFNVGLFAPGDARPAFEATVTRDAAPRMIALTTDPQAAPSTGWTAESFYSRYAFHGPSFQGLRRVTAVGPRSIAAELTVTTLPGLDATALAFDPALLDCAGQLVAFWLLEHGRHAPRFGIFPFAARRIVLHGPTPPPGTRVRCRGDIALHDGVRTEASFVFSTPDGRTLATIEGLEQRLMNFPDPIARWIFGGEIAELSQPDPARGNRVTRRISAADWLLLTDQGGIWQRALAHLMLAESELATFVARPTGSERLDWLLERIAAKEAVRLWAEQHGMAAPDVSEIAVLDDWSIECSAFTHPPHLELRRAGEAIVAAVWSNEHAAASSL